MFIPPKNHWTVPFDNSFKVASAATTPSKELMSDKKNKRELKELTKEIAEIQNMFYAHDKHALLLIFQAMDAAGKDGTIRAVMKGINPAGCQVYSFKQPSTEELDHDFLWRTTRCLPERGRIGIFNRSYYEEVLVVKVHPEYLGGQKLPGNFDTESIWAQRYESIRDHEKHLARNGTIVMKFWLNVSKEEQKKRFLSRLNEPEKHWKFSAGDIKERGYWEDYMLAYEELLNETSRPWAPWYAIPADNKASMRTQIASIIKEALVGLDMHYPEVDKKEHAQFDEMRKNLEEE